MRSSRLAGLVETAIAPAGREHLLVLSFLDALKGEALDRLCLVGTFAEGRFASPGRRRLARIAADGGGGFVVFHRRGRERATEQFGAGTGEVARGDGGARASVDVGEFARARRSMSAALMSP